ncbi:tyrosine-type recombinase/integrase [Gymnodinialimonas sp.]
MTISNALTQLKAKNLGPGKYFDGQGLMLVKSRKDAGKWIVRLVVDGKRREMGLGRWPDVSIVEAREGARVARSTLRGGVDPVGERQKARRTIGRLTVAEAIQGCFEAKQAELKNDGHAGRWMSPLSVHVLPKIGGMAIEDVDQHELKRVLEPIWHVKADTARKAMNRMSLTLKHAAALGLDVDLQAVMKAQALLGKRRHTTTHIPSLPYQEAPAFYQWLGMKPFVSSLALRFLMLTATRTSEVRFATFDEIDGDIWTIPASRTKTSVEHRVPLSDEAMKIVGDARQDPQQKLLFPTARGNPMSDATMSRFMQREGYEARPHGFRATFRSWAEECTDASFEVKETALGHQVGSEVERSYQRSDYFDKRKLIIAVWNSYLTETHRK